jgi:hypothetical protein
MTEIKKITKIVMIYYGVMGLLFSFLYLVLTDFFAFQLMQWPTGDPVPFWSLGMTMLVLAIASFLAYFKTEWDKIKLYFEIMLMWIIGTILMNIAILVIITLPETAMFQIIFNIILLTFNLVIGIFSYIKQRS